MSAQDAARAVMNHLPVPAAQSCARFTLAVDPANERLVEDVWKALSERGLAVHESDVRALLAVIAQSAGGDRG